MLDTASTDNFEQIPLEIDLIEPWKDALEKIREKVPTAPMPSAQQLQTPAQSEVRRTSPESPAAVITLPSVFAFKPQGQYDFDSVLSVFDWTLKGVPVTIDISKCGSANYQALSLIVLYAWKLKANDCRVSFKFQNDGLDATKMWKLIGGPAAIAVLLHENQNFPSDKFKPLVAVRGAPDFKRTISTIESFTHGFDVEYMNTLRQVLSELLYNTMEHGSSYFHYFNQNVRLPSVCQFTWYETKDEIHFIVADVGMGIKSHLSLTYPGIPDDASALRLAIRAKVSGTFARNDPYQAKNNAGMGLYISTSIVRRLDADMYLLSGSAVMHISPRDITVHNLSKNWPGTIALITVKLEKTAKFELHKMMQDFRNAAEMEQARADEAEASDRLYVNAANFFGSHADVKDEAVNFRDRYLVPAIDAGKTVVLDFDNVRSSPHSFLSALIATPIRRLGMAAFKKIKVINATPEIRETIDFILDENTD